MEVTHHNDNGLVSYEMPSRSTINDSNIYEIPNVAPKNKGVYKKVRFPIYAVVPVCVTSLAVLVLLSVQLWYISVLSNKVDQLIQSPGGTCGAGSAMSTPPKTEGEGPESSIATMPTPPMTEVPLPVDCPPTMPLRYLTKCYNVVTARKNHQDANEACTATHSGAHLVDVNSQGEQEQLVAWAGMNNMTNIWTSGVRRILVSGTSQFVWSNSNSTLVYTNWFCSEPNDANGIEDCLYMRGDRHWQWNDEECSEIFPSICEYP